MVERIRNQLGNKKLKLKLINLQIKNMPPIIFELIFTKDNNKKYIEQIITEKDGIIERELLVRMEKIQTNKYESTCAPPQWIADKINKTKILFNYDENSDRCELFEPKISFIITSGTFILQSKIKTKHPHFNYWTIL